MKMHFAMILTMMIYQVKAFCLDLSTFVLDNKYLKNNIIGKTRVPSLLDCAVTCESDIECLSFGFEHGTRACHHHTKDSHSAPEDLVGKNQWKHGDILSFPAELFGPCRDHNCTAGQKCKINRVTKRSYCSKGFCPSPPALPNAIINDSSQEIGTSLNYTCVEGYLDAESFIPSAVTTCLPNNTWSLTDLNCIGPFVTLTQSNVGSFKFAYEMIEMNTLEKILLNTSSLIFWVKTCRDSNIALCAGNTSDECYEIIIGGWFNARVVIRWPIDGSFLVRLDETNIVSCTEFRPFWVSWRNGLISVGKGIVVGNQMFVETEMVHFNNTQSVWLTCYMYNEAVWVFLQHNQD